MAYGAHRGTIVPRRADIVTPRHVTTAEEAQARVFERMLRAEIVELLNLPPAGRAEMRSRIEELDRLIKALRHRFPSAPLQVREVRPIADRAPRALLT